MKKPFHKNRKKPISAVCPQAADIILSAAVTGMEKIESGTCTLDDYLDYDTPPEYRNTIAHLLFSHYRYRGFLTSALSSMTTRPPEKKVERLLLAAMTQMRFQSGIAPESAASIAVDAAKRYGGASGFVNAVLRRFMREQAEIEITPELLFPKAVCRRWSKRFSRSELQELAELFTREVPFTFRRERGCGELSFAAAALERENDYEYFQADSHAVLESPELRAGKIYIQDPATGFAPSLADTPLTGGVLDFCAAPGGKAIMLYERFGIDGKLTAFDRSRARQKLTEKNFSIRHIPAAVLSGDTKQLEDQYDTILTDVPCSNTGVFRRRPDALWRFSRTELEKTLTIQRSILKKTAPMVKVGGQLIYSTCSIEPEENTQMAGWFLREFAQFELEQEQQFYPCAFRDGGYCCSFRRTK